MIRYVDKISVVKTRSSRFAKLERPGFWWWSTPAFTIWRRLKFITICGSVWMWWKLKRQTLVEPMPCQLFINRRHSSNGNRWKVDVFSSLLISFSVRPFHFSADGQKLDYPCQSLMLPPTLRYSGPVLSTNFLSFFFFWQTDVHSSAAKAEYWIELLQLSIGWRPLGQSVWLPSRTQPFCCWIWEFW